MSEDIKLYYYRRWRQAESGVGKMEVLYDFIIDNEEIEELFDLIDIEELELMDTIELEDFYEEYQYYIEEKWHKLIYDYEDEEDDEN